MVRGVPPHTPRCYHSKAKCTNPDPPPHTLRIGTPTKHAKARKPAMNITKKLHTGKPSGFRNTTMRQSRKFLSPIVGALREIYARLTRALKGLRGCMNYDHQIQRMGRLVPPRRGFAEVAASTARGFRDSMPPNRQGSAAGKQSA